MGKWCLHSEFSAADSIKKRAIPAQEHGFKKLLVLKNHSNSEFFNRIGRKQSVVNAGSRPKAEVPCYVSIRRLIDTLLPQKKLTGLPSVA
jgi:hypothetical protein